MSDLAGKSDENKLLQARVEELDTALRKAHERVESILANISEPYVIFDQQWRYIQVNEAAAHAIGLPREQLLGYTLWEIYPDIIGTELETRYRHAMEQRVPVTFEFYYPTTGTWWENRFYPVAEGLAVLAANITERKRAEQALKASEEEAKAQAARCQSILDAAPAIILTAHDREGLYITGNRTARELHRIDNATNLSKTGQDPELVEHFQLYKDGRELLPEEMPIQIVAKSGRELTNYSLELVLGDGTEHSLLGNVVPVLDSEGKPSGATAAFMDITELKKTEEELRKSEARLSVATNQAGMGTFDIDLLTGKSVWSANLFGLLGYEPSPNGEGTFKMWRSRVHLDDLERVLHEYERARLEHNFYRSEYRAIRVDTGEEIWLLVFAQYIYNENEDAVRFVGIVFDCTTRKRTEEELAKSNDELSKRVLELHEISKSFEEVNVAVRVLLRQGEEDRKKFGESILNSIKNHIFPYIKELKATSLSSNQMTWIRILESHIDEITSQFSKTLAAQYANLSPSEIRIADLTKDGRSTADIADLLNISEKTVCRHKENIRHKLGLRGSRSNLRTHLLNLTSSQELDPST